MPVREAFWSRHPGLAWSNSKADDSVRIRAALMRPRFHRILDIANEFGLDCVQAEWDALLADEDAAVRRAKPIDRRILGTIGNAYAHADSRG